MFALAIIIANVAGIYYWRQDRKGQVSSPVLFVCNKTSTRIFR